MKFCMSVIKSGLLLLVMGSAGLLAQEAPAPIPFRTTIELALKNSPTSGVASADLQRARASYLQARDLFLPQATLGSGLAFSYGFPLSLEGSAPSVFNVNIQEFIFNPAQRAYIKAAKTGIDQTASQNADRRNDTIMETAVDYIQLDTIQSSITILHEQQDMAAKLEDIVSQRVQAGLDSHHARTARFGAYTSATEPGPGRGRPVAAAALAAHRAACHFDHHVDREHSATSGRLAE